jgi:hypothetical protein
VHDNKHNALCGLGETVCMIQHCISNVFGCFVGGTQYHNPALREQ